MTTDNGRAFNEWLRAQLKAKKMSQRQLAQQSGVDHSTISRLIRGDRMPSLGTATKLARGLREIRDDTDASAALGVVSVGPQNPTARVEYALRADEALSEPQVRQIMEYYLAVRLRRFNRPYAPGAATEPGIGTNGGAVSAASPYSRPPFYSSATATQAVVRPAPPRYGGPRPLPARPPTRNPGRP
jgi:transcriptional regulator with XRE-family HTH domain